MTGKDKPLDQPWRPLSSTPVYLKVPSLWPGVPGGDCDISVHVYRADTTGEPIFIHISCMEEWPTGRYGLQEVTLFDFTYEMSPTVSVSHRHFLIFKKFMIKRLSNLGAEIDAPECIPLPSKWVEGLKHLLYKTVLTVTEEFCDLLPNEVDQLPVAWLLEEGPNL